MVQEIERIKKLFADEIEKIGSSSDIEQLRVSFCGKKGHVSDLMRQIAESRIILRRKKWGNQ